MAVELKTDHPHITQKEGVCAGMWFGNMSRGDSHTVKVVEINKNTRGGEKTWL